LIGDSVSLHVDYTNKPEQLLGCRKKLAILTNTSITDAIEHMPNIKEFVEKRGLWCNGSI
jgi:hypothetical protein